MLALYTSSCDACGGTVHDPDQILCDACRDDVWDDDEPDVEDYEYDGIDHAADGSW